MKQWLAAAFVVLIPALASAQTYTSPSASLEGDISLDTSTLATAAKQDEQTAVLGAVSDAAATQGSTGSISAKLRTLTAQLNTLSGYLDGLETLITATNGYVDGLEGYVDGIETLIGTTNSTLSSLRTDITTTLAAYVDGLESVLGATGDSAATAGSTGSLSAKLRLATSQLDTIATSLSGMATNIATLASGLYTEVTADADTGAGTQTIAFTLLGLPASGGAVAGGTSTNPLVVNFTSTILGYIDGLEGYVDQLEGYVDGVEGSLTTIAGYLAPASVTPIQSDNTNNDDETQIKGSPGTLLSVSGRNVHASNDAYVRCVDATAASTTPGSTTVVYEAFLPHGGGFVPSTIGPGGATFSTAITCYVATGKALSDATDAAQDDVHVNVVWR